MDITLTKTDKGYNLSLFGLDVARMSFEGAQYVLVAFFGGFTAGYYDTLGDAFEAAMDMIEDEFVDTGNGMRLGRFEVVPVSDAELYVVLERSPITGSFTVHNTGDIDTLEEAARLMFQRYTIDNQTAD